MNHSRHSQLHLGVREKLCHSLDSGRCLISPDIEGILRWVLRTSLASIRLPSGSHKSLNLMEVVWELFEETDHP